jgi:hypothetical protein
VGGGGEGTATGEGCYYTRDGCDSIPVERLNYTSGNRDNFRCMTWTDRYDIDPV